MEHMPEVFARVSMLYINATINNQEMQVFVDSGWCGWSLFTRAFAAQVLKRRSCRRRARVVVVSCDWSTRNSLALRWASVHSAYSVAYTWVSVRSHAFRSAHICACSTNEDWHGLLARHF
jgi:hypothetical protein